jgi:hypothetical protein
MAKRKIKTNYPFYKVVSDGGLSLPSIGEGRLIPAIIIDNNGDIGITDLIKLHSDTPPGDTTLSWFLPDTFFAPTKVYLSIEFIRPMKLSFGIEFQLSNQFTLVDGIIKSRAFYLIAGKIGDKVSQRIKDGILVEVPNMDFDKKWDELLMDAVKKRYKKMGTSKKERQVSANAHIKSMREVWNWRDGSGIRTNN